MRFQRTAVCSIAVAIGLLSFATVPPASAAENIVKRSNLPDSLLNQVHTLYRFQGVTQHEAEALFASAVAAVYYPERSEVRLLADDGLQTAQEWLELKADWSSGEGGSKESPDIPGLQKKIKSTTPMGLRNFLDPSSSELDLGIQITAEPYLAKIPVFEPNGTMSKKREALKRIPVTKTTKNYHYIYDDFEGDVWSNWSRTDNTGGEFTWGVRGCDAYYSSYSADAPRGGSQGALLGCSSPYPSSIETYMYTTACESIPEDWVAYLDFMFTESIDQDGDDEFAVLFEDESGSKWGWLYWGTTPDWYELVFNLRQWYRIGDLGVNYCNTLYLKFQSDSLNGTGYGARVDDLYVYYGDTTGSYQCGIIADPEDGVSPLTVAFRATTDMYDPAYYWRFGDGATSEAKNPAYVFSAAGEYHVTLNVYDGWGTVCNASKTIVVTQGACSYSLSPTTHTLGPGSSSGDFTVTAPSGCTWTATTSSSWIHISGGSSGNGNGTVSYSVDANPGTSQRSGTIQVADQTFTITQAGVASCSYTISPTSQSFAAGGGTGTIAISTSSGCSWTAVANNSWITVTGGSSGTGSGTVSYRVDANSNTSSRTGSLAVAGHTFSVSQAGTAASSDYHYLVAGIAHALGEGDSVWRSTLAVTNRSGSTAHVTLIYRHDAGTVERSIGLANKEIVEWDDVAETLFDESGGSAGSVEVLSDRPVIVTARTFNESPDGTFGQFLPGADETVELSSGQVGILPQVKKTSDYRCNIGFVNLSTTSCTVKTRLYSASGVQLGSTISTDVSAGSWKQINDAFGKAGVSSCELGYATVEVTTSGCSAWAYASIVDNESGDPTTIPVYVR